MKYIQGVSLVTEEQSGGSNFDGSEGPFIVTAQNNDSFVDFTLYGNEINGNRVLIASDRLSCACK